MTFRARVIFLRERERKIEKYANRREGLFRRNKILPVSGWSWCELMHAVMAPYVIAVASQISRHNGPLKNNRDHVVADEGANDAHPNIGYR